MKQPFERVVEQHGPMVLRVCRAVLGSHTDADDAWSDTFLSALRAYPDLPHDANVEAWLVTIAHRKAVDVTRSRSRAEPVVAMPERIASDGQPGEDDPDLWAEVGALPDKQRHVIAYRYLGGLAYDDIAAIVGGTAAAARRAAADGIENLRTRCSRG